jgi:hypothetical protein
MSDSSRVRVSIVAESSFGVTPDTPTMLVLPITGVSMGDRIGYVQSNVITPTRDVSDLVRLSKSAGGGVPCELRYSPNGGGLNAAIAAVLGSTFTAATTQVTNVACVGGDPTSSLVASGIETGIEVGDIVRVLDASDDLVAYVKVVGVASGSLTVDAVLDDAGGGLKVLRGARIKNGTSKTSFTVEVAYLDLQMAHIFTGQYFASCEMSVAIGSLTTASFTLEGKTSSRVTSNTGTTDQFITGASYTAVASHPSLDPIGVVEVRVASEDYAASQIAITLNNNVRPREQLGALGPTSMAFGQFGAAGRVSAYFTNFDDHDDFAENRATDLWYAQIDENGRGYSMSYPQAKFSSVQNPTQGNNTDVFKNIDVTAYLDPVEGCTLRLQRWGD